MQNAMLSSDTVIGCLRHNVVQAGVLRFEALKSQCEAH